MPMNLNALIRYKQIDKCLRNRYKPCTIRMLQEACSEALGEYRGIYKLVSERAIRDDIRIMRSNILGFNAPIEVEGGYYTYSDPEYSIFNISITDMNLLKDVFHILIEVKGKISSKAYFKVLVNISELTGLPLPDDMMQEMPDEIVNEPDVIFIPSKRTEDVNDKEDVYNIHKVRSEKHILHCMIKGVDERIKIDWGTIFKIV